MSNIGESNIKFSDLRSCFGGRSNTSVVYASDYFGNGQFADKINYSAEEETSAEKKMSFFRNKGEMRVSAASVNQSELTWSGANYSFVRVVWPSGFSNIPYGISNFTLPADADKNNITIIPLSQTLKQKTTPFVPTAVQVVALVSLGNLNFKYAMLLNEFANNSNANTSFPVSRFGFYQSTVESEKPIYYTSGGYNNGPYLKYQNTASNKTKVVISPTNNNKFMTSSGIAFVMLMKPTAVTNFERYASIMLTNGGWIELHRNATNNNITFSLYNGVANGNIAKTTSNNLLVTNQWVVIACTYTNNTKTVNIKMLPLASPITSINNISAFTDCGSEVGALTYADYTANGNTSFGSYYITVSQVASHDFGGGFVIDSAMSDGDLVNVTNFLLSGSLSMNVPKLDTMSSAGKSSLRGLWALKRLFTTYTGPVVTIRRSSDNITSDFYADHTGVLGTALNGTGTTIYSWLSGSTAYVTKWWDQSGSGNHATQSNIANQPILDITDNCLDYATNSFFVLPDGTVPYGNADYSIAGRVLKGANDSPIISSGIPYSTGTCNCVEQVVNGAYLVNYWWSNDISVNNASNDNNVFFFSYVNTVGRSAYINSALQTTQSNVNRNSSSTYNAIGRDYRGDFGPYASKYFKSKMTFVCVSASGSLAVNDRILIERI